MTCNGRQRKTWIYTICNHQLLLGKKPLCDPREKNACVGPSFCTFIYLFISFTNSNADRVSWWELTALASHVHPSVSKMANTLLFSGTNIVYNGNPLNDLSLTAFLDKFMEKKPKSSTWHGGSQIEPAKKVSYPYKICLSFML